MRPIDRSPARLSAVVAGGMGVLAFLASGLFSWSALRIGLIGFGLIVLGLVLGSRAAVTVGTTGLFLGGLVAGSQGAPPIAVLVSVTAAVLAWDIGSLAISVGRQLGTAATTHRLELVHIAASTGIGVAMVVGGSLVYATASGGQPVTALVLLIVAALILLAALRSESDEERRVEVTDGRAAADSPE